MDDPTQARLDGGDLWQPLRLHRLLDSSRLGGWHKGFRRQIRSWMRNLSEFIHSYDFIRAHPAPDWILAKPASCLAAALATPGGDYVGYLADRREVTDPAAGKPLSGPLSSLLPAGDYSVSLYSRGHWRLLHLACKFRVGNSYR